MINFDEKLIIEQGASIYNQRDKIEAIADQIHKDGFDLLFFTSSGGSMAMLEPFNFFVNHMSKLPTASMISADLLHTGCNRLTDRSVAFMSSKSGNTAETLEAARYLKERGVRIVSVNGVADSPLEELSDYTVVYKDGRPQELVFYLLIFRLLYLNGDFPQYPKFADELKNLASALCQVRKECDEKCKKYSEDYYAEPYNIFIASGDLWPVAYSFSMCVLEESQWIRTKSVTSPEFFHGTLELVEPGVCVTLCLTDGPTRDMDERVKRFCEKHTDKLTCFDVCDYSLPGISEEFRKYLGPVIMNAILQRISRNIEVVTKHSVTIRRYYRVTEY